MPRAKASFMKSGEWRLIRNCILLMGSSAILLCISTLAKFCYLKSFPESDPPLYHHPTSPIVTHSTLDAVIHQIQEEIREMKNPQIESSRIRAFLSEISNHLESIRSSSAPLKGEENPVTNQHPLVKKPNEPEDFFVIEEMRKYVKMKPNRLKKQNFMGAEGAFTSIGHACFAMREDLEKYMDYDVGELCNDDWKLAQKLMIRGCDPLPRRRCLARAPRFYRKRSLPLPSSAWSLPDDRSVRWSHYKCKNFACLARNSTSSSKGFHKCAQCFNLTHHEKPRWVETPATTTAAAADFLIPDVLKLKPPGDIRIGLDFSVGTGTFAARMSESNVTIVSAAINLGAPFSETIALRGLVPLYVTINQRLPFFDNTLDLIHTTRFLDGWIDLVLLDFVLYDWDRVLRPGGLLWVDGFFCLITDLEDYLKAFRMLRYKRHKWVVVPKLDKHDKEVFFSAVLEKPPRPF